MTASTLPLEVTQSEFGKLPTGEVVTTYKMANSTGMSVAILDYGCAVTNLVVPDKNGLSQDVVLGFDSLEQYLDSSINAYYGCKWS